MTGKEQASERIIFVNRFFYPDYSATSQMLSDLAFALAAEGFCVTVVTSRLSYDNPAVQLPDRETVQGVSVRRVWTTRFGRGNLKLRAFDYLTFYLSTFLALLCFCRRSDVIVAKTDPPMLGAVATVVAGIRGCKTINWLQDVFPEVAAELGMINKRGATFRLLKRLRDWSLKRAACNVVLGKRMAERIKACGVVPDAISIVPNWADGDAITPLPRDENPLRDAWGLGNKLVIGYCGNLGRAHDWKSISDAAIKLRDRDDIVFVVIGGGAGYEELKHSATLRAANNIVFKPYQPREQLRYTLTLPDIHLISLHPRLEGLIVPSKFYGVLAAARPAIFLGDVHGEIADIVKGASCGWQIRYGDDQAIVNMVCTEGASDTATRFGLFGRSLFDRQYGLGPATRDWMGILDKATANESVATIGS